MYTALTDYLHTDGIPAIIAVYVMYVSIVTFSTCRYTWHGNIASGDIPWLLVALMLVLFVIPFYPCTITGLIWLALLIMFAYESVRFLSTRYS